MSIVSFPAPNPRTRKGLVTLERFLGCAGTWLNRNVMQYRSRAVYTLLCNGIQNRRAAFLDSWPCTALLRNRMQYHMKIVELQSDWLVWKQKCWACKNQESAQLSPDPFPRRGWGLGMRLMCLLSGVISSGVWKNIIILMTWWSVRGRHILLCALTALSAKVIFLMMYWLMLH